MLDIIISESVNVNIVLTLIVIGFICILYRISRNFNQDMRTIYAEFGNMVDENVQLKIEIMQLRHEVETLKAEKSSLSIQVLKQADKLDVERTK